MRLLARRAVAALAAVAILWTVLALATVSPSRADQCPPVATTSVAMRVNGHVSIGGVGGAVGTAILAIGPGVGVLPSGCTVLIQQGTYAIMLYGYDPAVSMSQTYPRESDTITMYMSDATGNLTLLRPSQAITFRSGTTLTVDLCASCTQNAASTTAPNTPTPTPTPSPTPVALATATASPTVSATQTPSGMPAPAAAAVAGGAGSLPPQFAGTPSASLPSNFASGGPDTSAQAPPPAAHALSAPPPALVVPGPVQLPPDGSVAVTVVLRGGAPAPGEVGPALKIASGTLVSDASTGGAFAGTLSPPDLEPPPAASPASGQALESGYVPALVSGGEATYVVQAGGAQTALFSQPAMLSLPAQPPSGYEPADLRVAWFDPALAGWRDVSGASSDGTVVVAAVDRTGLYAVVAGAAGSFRRFWVQTYRPTTLWSGSDTQAVALGVAEQWHHLVVLAPQQGPRLFVKNPSTGGAAYVDASDVGPSGPP